MYINRKFHIVYYLLKMVNLIIKEIQIKTASFPLLNFFNEKNSQVLARIWQTRYILTLLGKYS